MKAEVAIVGAGQAGLATSYHLTRLGIPHTVLERGRIGEAWRRRWDSFCLVTPNWTITLPGAEYLGPDPQGFMPRDDFIAHLEDWARRFGCPVQENVAVHSVRHGFVLETSNGPVHAKNVVIAASTYQRPKMPALAAVLPPRLFQLHAESYQRVDDLPDGGVLVVGSGQTGCQIADELDRHGRNVWLAVGSSGRLPRRYRGRDIIEWMRDYGFLDKRPEELDDPGQRFGGDPHLTGRNGGATLSLHEFHQRGIRLLGHLDGIDSERLELAGDLAANMRRADEVAAAMRRLIDGYVEQAGEEAPEASDNDLFGEPPSGWSVIAPRELDLAQAGITSVVWATGFEFDFSWIEGAPLDTLGYPITRGGVSGVPGLYFAGLNYMTKRKSGIIYGVGEDAARVAWHIKERLAGSAS